MNLEIFRSQSDPYVWNGISNHSYGGGASGRILTFLSSLEDTTPPSGCCSFSLPFESARTTDKLCWKFPFEDRVPFLTKITFIYHLPYLAQLACLLFTSFKVSFILCNATALEDVKEIMAWLSYPISTWGASRRSNIFTHGDPYHDHFSWHRAKEFQNMASLKGVLCLHYRCGCSYCALITLLNDGSSELLFKMLYLEWSNVIFLLKSCSSVLLNIRTVFHFFVLYFREINISQEERDI